MRLLHLSLPQPGRLFFKLTDHLRNKLTELTSELSLFYNFWTFTIFTSSILAFLEYLHQNSVSPKVIRNYISYITYMAYNFKAPAAFHSCDRFLRSLSKIPSLRPKPRGIFSLRTLYVISRAYDSLRHPPCLELLTALRFKREKSECPF